MSLTKKRTLATLVMELYPLSYNPCSVMLKIPVRLITPKPYGIYSQNFTDSSIISRSFVRSKENNSGLFGFELTLLAKNPYNLMLSSCPALNS